MGHVRDDGKAEYNGAIKACLPRHISGTQTTHAFKYVIVNDRSD